MRKLIYVLTIGIFLANFLHTADFSEESMKIHEYFTELFREDPLITDWYTYELLKKNPLKKNVNFLAIPWRALIVKKQLNKVPNIKLDGGFTICRCGIFEKILPILERIGIDTLFTPCLKKGKIYKRVKVLPFPQYAMNGVGPSEKKDIWYSFVGVEITHRVRKSIFGLPKRNDVVLIKRDKWHFNLSEKERKNQRKEYQDILARSRYSLCPRGTNPSSSRFWESLQAGAIPVVISDDMDLPKNFNWDSCCLRVPEKDVKKMPTILKRISQEQEQFMREQCYKAYEQFSGEHLISPITYYYGC